MSLKETLKIGLNLQSGRSITVLADDVFIVSYPKSGNTWTRFLIGCVYHGEAITFATLEKKVPDIYQNHNKVLLKFPRPRLIKSHEYFEPRYKKVVYIVRDPRDVAVSYYFHCRKFNLMKDSVTIEEFAPAFLRGDLDVFGSWGENVGSWIGARGQSPDFLLLRYEDLQTDTLGELRKTAKFLGLSPREDLLRLAVESSSADVMREQEQTQGEKWKGLRETRKDIPFVRTARAGGWRESLPPAIARQIETAWAAPMRQLGYLDSAAK